MLDLSKTIETTTLTSFLNKVLTNGKYTWHRGEASNYGKTSLTPSIFRGDGYDEKSMFHVFRCTHYEAYKEYNNFQWLCLMQHYKLPTRLLDWTTNPLVALYFATKDTTNDGFVYSINPKHLNLSIKHRGFPIPNSPLIKIRVEMAFFKDPKRTITSDIFNSLQPQNKKKLEEHLRQFYNYPIALHPEITNLRMIAQSSCFTIHGGTLNDNKRTDECTDVVVYKIPKNSKPIVQKQLEVLSIHEGSLYPEIEYTAQYLKEKYKH